MLMLLLLMMMMMMMMMVKGEREFTLCVCMHLLRGLGGYAPPQCVCEEEIRAYTHRQTH